jgi:hypothetical protein
MTRNFRISALAAALAMAGPATAFAQSSDPDWLEQLRLQAAEIKECAIAYIMNMREGELGGSPTYEARFKCEDGRMFDAFRAGRIGEFEFKACEIQVC